MYNSYSSIQMENNTTMNHDVPAGNLIPTPSGDVQNMHAQMEQNFYDQQWDASSNYNYKVPNAEVVNVPMHENVSTTTAFDLSLDELMAFNSQSYVDNNCALIDSPNVATPSYDDFFGPAITGINN